MVDEQKYLRRLARLEQDLEGLLTYRGITVDRLAAELDVRWAAERGLHVVIEGILDLGAHVLASDFGVQGRGYRESATLMVEQGIVSTPTFPRIASFRNVLVHEYVKMDLAVLEDILSAGLDDLQTCVNDLRKRAWEHGGE
jgi:uncharacterized protein YutE (UPF0331/DUF86 family)